MQLVASLDGVEQSLSATRQQMSTTANEPGLTLSYDASELQHRLDAHDALMHKLASQAAQLQATRAQMEALDTDIVGE